MSRNRNWVITLNNYQNTELFDNVICKYIAYSKEVAPTTGTPHLQGFISYNNPRSFKSISKLFPRAHLEVAKGTDFDSKVYCSKDDNSFE